jgi:hypothetical protein
MDRVCSVDGGMKNAYKILIGMLEGKRPLGRSGCRWENNIENVS